MQAGSLVRDGQADALRTDVPAIVAMGPVAEPLRDWLAELPADWAGMGKHDFLNWASLAMGYPVYTRSVGRQMFGTDWEFRRGRLARVALDTPLAPVLQAVA